MHSAKFHYYANEQRSQSIYNVLDKAGPLFNRPSDVFKSRKLYTRSADPELLAYLKWPGDKGYSSLPPILFEDHRKGDMATLFQSIPLVLVSGFALHHISRPHCIQTYRRSASFYSSETPSLEDRLIKQSGYCGRSRK